MKKVIELRNVSKQFDGETVLDSINLDIYDNEFLTLLGPSGCGKTTTLRMIGGFETPDQGDILFLGERINDIPPHKRNINTVFQRYALFPHLNVFENVAFPLREQTDFDEEMIRDLVLMKLDAVGLRGAADLMPSAISGGMARRVALARAIALDPALIMYDEPFAGLDPISMGITAQLIRKLTDALQATAIIVTHDVAETFEIADYVYMVNAGRIAAQGTPEELTASTDPYVCQFLKGLPDGPVAFHYPAKSVEEEFGVRS